MPPKSRVLEPKITKIEDSGVPIPSPIGFPIFPEAPGHPSPLSKHRDRPRALRGLATGEARFGSGSRIEGTSKITS